LPPRRNVGVAVVSSGHAVDRVDWYRRLMATGPISRGMQRSSIQISSDDSDKRMINRIRQLLEAIRSSYWFLPTVMTAIAAAGAFCLVWIDEVVRNHWVLKLDWIYTGGAEGARQLLSTVAGSMITIAGVVFSITVVALSMASNQFGPRLLRNFMRDRGNQLVLGTFIATFVFCLLVLRTIRGTDDGEFVPHLSVTAAVLLTLASVGVLIYFIHHAAVSMQAPVVIANVGDELRDIINHLFPNELGDDSPADLESETAESASAGDEPKGRAVSARSDGYIQSVATKQLLETATENDVVIHVLHRPGHFLVEGQPLARYQPADDAAPLDDSIADAFLLGSVQTPTQDFEFVANQLVEIAVRALSPGVNDPFTAVNCVDQLGAGLCLLARRRIPSALHHDDEHNLRVILYPWTFADVVDCVFRPLRQYGSSSAPVVTRLLDTIGAVMAHARKTEDRRALLHHARLIKQSAEAALEEPDRLDVQRRFDQLPRA
jgi:uncharacterized membrane protein